MMKAHAIMLAIAAMFVATFAAAAPSIGGLPSIALEKDGSGMERALDLRLYTSDPGFGASQMGYSIESQSKPDLVDCFIQDGYYISCSGPAEGSEGISTISVRAVNPQGLEAHRTLNVAVSGAPEAVAASLSVDRQEAAMESGRTISFRLTAENNSGKNNCYTASTVIGTGDRHDIKAEISEEGFCLASGESTDFTMSVSSPAGGMTGTYEIEARIEDSKGKIATASALVEVVDDEGALNIERTGSYYVCREPYRQEVSVRLENNSSRAQNISLNAENAILMPTFEFADTKLRHGESDEFAMAISTSALTELGEYTIPVFITSENYYVEKEIRIMLTECGKNTFTMELEPQKISLKKGGSQQAKIVLTSLVNYDQEIFLSADGNLILGLSEMKVMLKAKASKAAYLEVKAPENANDGKYYARVYAWSTEKSVRKTLEVAVKPEHGITLSAENNDFGARICSANNGQTFAVTVSNTGNYTENISFKLDNRNSEIQAVLSDKRMELEEGEDKIVYVFIAPSYSAEPGDYRISIAGKSSNAGDSQELRFRVVETAGDIQKNVLQILSYPTEISLQPGEEKAIQFSIRNPTGGDMRNVKVTIYGAEGGAIVFPASFSLLKAGETKEISRAVTALENAGDREFDATLEVKADGYITVKAIKIKVGGKQGQSTENGFLAGLAVLLGNSGAQLGIILIIAIALIIAIGTAFANRKGGKDASFENGQGA